MGSLYIILGLKLEVIYDFYFYTPISNLVDSIPKVYSKLSISIYPYCDLTDIEGYFGR